MKKFIQIAFALTLIIAMFCGCENPFSKTKTADNTTASTTEEETTVQGNSEVVTLEKTSTTSPVSKELSYYSDNIGASFTLPSSWENKYALEDSEDEKGNKYLSFFEKDIHRIDNKGLIFTYNLFLSDSYKKKGNYIEYGTVTNEEGQIYYIVCTKPNSPQYDEKNKSLKKAYKALSKDKYITSICSSAVFDGGMIVDEEGCSTTTPTTAPVATDENGEEISKPDTTKSNSSTTGLVFPDVSSRNLTDSEVKALSSDQIQQAINDICALHGYNFTTPEIKSHYEQFSWYSPSSDFSEASFSDIEKYNYELLQKYR